MPRVKVMTGYQDDKIDGLKGLVYEHGMNFKEFSKASGVSYPTIMSYIKKEINIEKASYAILRKMANALNFETVDDFVREVLLRQQHTTKDRDIRRMLFMNFSTRRTDKNYFPTYEEILKDIKDKGYLSMEMYKYLISYAGMISRVKDSKTINGHMCRLALKTLDMEPMFDAAGISELHTEEGSLLWSKEKGYGISDEALPVSD